MSIKEYIKQAATVEKEKFSQMSFADKLWYIWEYYKFHIMAVIIAVVLIGTIGSTVYRNIYYRNALYGYVLNNYSEPLFDSTPYDEGFAGYMGYTRYEQLFLESSYISYGDEATEYSYAAMAKISALVASKDLDFMIMDEENFLHYMEMGAFADLRQTLPADVLDAAGNRLIYAADSEGNSRAYALSIADTAFSESSNLTPDCRYFGIVSNSQRTETAISLLRYILIP